VNWTQREKVAELVARQHTFMQGKYFWFQYFEIYPAYGKMVCWYSNTGLGSVWTYHEEVIFY